MKDDSHRLFSFDEMRKKYFKFQNAISVDKLICFFLVASHAIWNVKTQRATKTKESKVKSRLARRQLLVSIHSKVDCWPGDDSAMI